MAIGPYLFSTVGGHDIHGVTAHGIRLGEEFALPGKETVLLSDKRYTCCQTHENPPVLSAIVVEEKTRILCDSALLSQHTTDSRLAYSTGQRAL